MTSIPMQIRNNRIYATFGVPVASGAREPIVFAIDTGGGAVIIARHTADRMGLKERSTTSDAPNGFVPIGLDAVYVGETRIPVGYAATTVAETDRYAPAAACAGFFAGASLSDHVVTFDYIGGTLTLDGPPLDHAATLPVRINPNNGFPRIELTIDGETYGFLFDTGASFTMLSRTVVDRVRAKHADWPYREGAYGPANMIGAPEAGGAMMRLRDVRWGGIALGDVDVVTRPPGTFEGYMSKVTAGPVVGALGGNVLRNVAARLDYPRAALTVRYERRPWADELDVVPLIIEPHQDGTYTIAGGEASDGLNGKQLLSVDRHSVAGLTLDDVQQLLRGSVGALRSIEVSGERTADRRIVSVF